MRTNALSLQGHERDEPARDGGGGGWVLVALALVFFLGLSGLSYVVYEERQRSAALERQVTELTAQVARSNALAQQGLDRAIAAEDAARAAAEGRQVAEIQARDAQQEASTARLEADTARQTAAEAQAEAARIRQRAEAEVQRLESALGQIADTRRTALGLVMNLGGDHLKFEFDKANLRTSDKELLSRIAGIMLTSSNYRINVVGHTDDKGSVAYNQKLSEQRARAVRDYFVQAGLSPDILTVEGAGESRPLVKGTSEAARAKNRRVEVGIVNTDIRYGRQAGTRDP